ncbi:hypothetical protein PENSPDRAFT_739828 [Peniophora sp. CONT]|nr:hypothetical protein PENSPDRAFT_739828 [Peniophora sp. CONT]
MFYQTDGDTIATHWNTVFQERLQELPQDAEAQALVSELHDVTSAYTDFCAALNARVENLRLPKLPSARTASAAALPADILLLIFSIFSEQEPLGDLCEWRGIRAGDSDSDGDSSVEAADSHHITPSCPQWCDCWLVPGLEWTRVTHVCSHWRRVALENAILWTTIPLSLCTPWLQELLLRSRSLPLNVTIPCDANWDAVETIISDCIHRIRSITAERGSAIINTILSRYPAPLLEILDIDQSTANVDPFTIPADIHTTIPRLKHLSISAVAFPPDMQYLAPLQLTHLSILTATVIPATTELCGLLQALRRVEFLQLENCLPAASEDICSQPIPFPHLETLILQGRASSCGAVMRSLVISPSMSVTLYMLPDEQPIVDSSTYMQRSGLGALLAAVCPTVFHSLHLSCVAIRPNEWQLIVAGLRHPCHIDRYVYEDTRIENNWTGPSYEDLKIVCMLPPIILDGEHSSHVLALSLFTHLMATLPLPSLSMLSLKVDALLVLDTNAWNCARWLSILPRAEKLEHIQLVAQPWQLVDPTKHAQPCPYVDLMLALSLGPHLSQKCILSPDLTEISLVNIDAAATVVVGAGAGRYLRTAASRVLHYFLSSRRHFGKENVYVSYTGISWQHRYFGNTDYGPLVKMGGEIVDMKEEHDQETVHDMISEAVSHSFPANALVT